MNSTYEFAFKKGTKSEDENFVKDLKLKKIFRETKTKN